jgi:hypothetical protein
MNSRDTDAAHPMRISVTMRGMAGKGQCFAIPSLTSMPGSRVSAPGRVAGCGSLGHHVRNIAREVSPMSCEAGS